MYSYTYIAHNRPNTTTFQHAQSDIAFGDALIDLHHPE